AESAATPEQAPVPGPVETTAWARYRSGAQFLAALGWARPARAVWNALPAEDWPARLAEAAQATVHAGRGVILVVPDARDIARLDAALGQVLPAGAHVTLGADLGPEARYKGWLAVRRAAVKVVVGTRSTVFAPVADLGLIVVWDDGDDLHAEPRAPYPHARDVAVLRSSLDGASLLIAGFAQTAESAMLLESGWAHQIAADRQTLR